MGVSSTAKVVTSFDRATPTTLQPGNREWVTVIECVNAIGKSIPPMIIFKAKMRQRSWYEAIPSTWTVGVSDNDWTTNKLGLHWVQTVFNHFTKDSTTEPYRLLILDGHGSHTAIDFHNYCYQNNIITLCMSAHSSHYLQPLDVSCFATLKRAYKQQVLDQMRIDINFIEKDDFLEFYQTARPLAFTCSSIQNGFRASGLIHLNPTEVLERLLVDIFNELATPSLQLPTQIWIPETPHNIFDLT